MVSDCRWATLLGESSRACFERPAPTSRSSCPRLTPRPRGRNFGDRSASSSRPSAAPSRSPSWVHRKFQLCELPEGGVDGVVLADPDREPVADSEVVEAEVVGRAFDRGAGGGAGRTGDRTDGRGGGRAVGSALRTRARRRFLVDDPAASTVTVRPAEVVMMDVWAQVFNSDVRGFDGPEPWLLAAGCAAGRVRPPVADGRSRRSRAGRRRAIAISTMLTIGRGCRRVWRRSRGV